MEFNGTVSGSQEVIDVFGRLPRSMQNKAYYRALFAGGGVVRDAASNNVKSIVSSEATGALAKNLRVYRLRKRTRTGHFRVAVQVRRGAVNNKKKDGKGSPVRIGLYGSVLEYGKKGQAPRSWIRRAARENKNQAVSRMRTEMGRRMIEALEDAKRGK